MLKAIWPQKQVLTLGNILTFRLEIEMLAASKGHSQASIYFEGFSAETSNQLPYFHPILSSGSIPIQPIFGIMNHQEMDWPPQDPEMEKWSYGSFKRVSLLWQKLQLFPQLRWDPAVLKEAEKLHCQLSEKGRRKVVAAHLKRQEGGIEESNAELEEWTQLFSEHPKQIFLLLGKDYFPSHLRFSNVFIASQLDVGLMTQLGFCSLCDGFLGMAAGISTAACLSLTPYVIFKHPLHHAEEMKMELGEGDSLPFARPFQKLWRKRGSIENLRAGMEILKL